MIILGVDLGKTRTGLAVCDKGESFAFPRGIIKEYNREKLFSKIAAEAQKEGAELIVVGLPRNMDGSEGFKAEESREAAEKLKALSGLPVALWDERCTTVLAHQSLHLNGKNAKNSKDVVDTVAATLILEDYLRYRKREQCREQD